MSSTSPETVTLTAQQLHGPTYGFGTVASVALLSAMVGAVIAGVIIPAAVTAMPDFQGQQRAEASSARDSALLVTLGALTLWAAPGSGAAPIATDMDLNGYLEDIEVRAAQLGLVAHRDVHRSQTALNVSFTFQDRPSATGIEPPASKAAKNHPRALQLVFEAGEAPGSLLLKETRADGRIRTAGQVFVDLVSMGGMKPQLQPGQVLTRRGVAEIRTGVHGSQALYLDGRAIYPATVPAAGVSPVVLKLDSSFPQSGLFSDHLLIVHAGTETGACSDRALIVDVVDLKLQTIDQPLVSGVMNPQDSPGSITMGPFCQPVAATTGEQAEQPSAPSLQPSLLRADGSQVIMHARLDLATNRIGWAPMIIPAPEPVIADPQAEAVPIVTAAATPTAKPTATVSAPWRGSDGTRIASPIVPGGVLVSLTCSREGHAAIAVSGLPAPADGQSATVRFAAGGSTAAAGMRWLPEAKVYELSGRTRPAETSAVINRLSAGGGLTVSHWRCQDGDIGAWS